MAKNLLTKGVESLANLFQNRNNTSFSGRKSAIVTENRSMPRLSTEELIAGYERFPWLRMVIDRIAELGGEVEWQAARQEIVTDTGRPRLITVPGHHVASLLMRGNEMFSGLALRQLSFKYFLILGEVFWFKEQNSKGETVELWPIPPTWVKETPLTNANGNFKLEVGGSSAEIRPTSIVWIYIPSPANPYLRGSSPAGTLADELGSDENASKYVNQFFYNSARPDLLVWSEDEENPIDEESSKRLEETWLSKVQGFWRARAPLFLPGKVGVKEFGTSFKDLNLTELRKFNRDAIMQLYGLSPEALGVLESANRATITAAETFVAKHVLKPKLKFLQAGMEHAFHNELERDMRLIFENPVPDDRDMQERVMRAHPYAFTVDEIREVAQFQPSEDEQGNIRAIPVNLEFTDNLLNVINQAAEDGNLEEEEAEEARNLISGLDRKRLVQLSELIASSIERNQTPSEGEN